MAAQARLPCHVAALHGWLPAPAQSRVSLQEQVRASEEARRSLESDLRKALGEERQRSAALSREVEGARAAAAKAEARARAAEEERERAGRAAAEAAAAMGEAMRGEVAERAAEAEVRSCAGCWATCVSQVNIGMHLVSIRNRSVGMPGECVAETQVFDAPTQSLRERLWEREQEVGSLMQQCSLHQSLCEAKERAAEEAAEEARRAEERAREAQRQARGWQAGMVPCQDNTAWLSKQEIWSGRRSQRVCP